jgi:hypothetical protein
MASIAKQTLDNTIENIIPEDLFCDLLSCREIREPSRREIKSESRTTTFFSKKMIAIQKVRLDDKLIDPALRLS